MNCIDAIEGTVKCIIGRIHQQFVEDRLDDTEYIRNVKVVLNAADQFIRQNMEITSEPELLYKVIYNYSKDLWLHSLDEILKLENQMIEAGDMAESKAYYHYYYDYIFNNDTYPH